MLPRNIVLRLVGLILDKAQQGKWGREKLIMYPFQVTIHDAKAVFGVWELDSFV